VLRDVRLAARLALHRPAVSAAVIVTLAVALGATTAILGVAWALLLKPLPFPDADRIIAVQAAVAGERGRLALQEYRELERAARTLGDIGVYYRTQYNVTGGATPQALTCTMPSTGLFRVLGVRPQIGDIWPSSLDFTRHYAVLLSHGIWQQRFGGRPDVVGQSITMDGVPYRVSGVLPAGVDFPLQTDVFRGVTDYNAPHVRRYSVVARLAEGRQLADARAELAALSRRFEATWPETSRGVILEAIPLRDAYVGGARPFVLLMVAGVVLLLAIAAVNVTNLLLARALSRQGDFAVQLALGAAPARLVRQVVLETVLLAGIGCLAGIPGAWAAVRALSALVAADLPPWLGLSIDPIVLVVSAGLALVVAIVVAAVPASIAARSNLEGVLRQASGRGAGGGPRLARRWLVGFQAAIASLLLVAAGVFASGLATLMRAPLGFDPERLLTFRLDPPFSRYGTIGTTAELYRRLEEEMRALPGVRAVGMNATLPFSRLDSVSPRVIPEGGVAGRADESPFVNLQLVNAAYFEAMRIPIVAGRAFDVGDREGGPPVAIVSERTARRLWNGNALGQRLQVVWNQNGTGAGGGDALRLTVVGVVATVRFAGVEDDSGLDVYTPHTQLFAGDSFVAIRTASANVSVDPSLRAAIDRVDGEQSYFDLQPMTRRIAATLWQQRVATAVLIVFAGIALLLATVGIFAVTAQAVASQRREIGIRLALGSSTAGLAWRIAAVWLMPVLVGAGLGLAGGLVVAWQLAALVGAHVPLPAWPLALPLVLATAGAVACSLPVGRAMRHVALADVLRDAR
jgi:putative ABC transport system permease protein